MEFPTFKKELDCLANGSHFVAGCDEVGVGPLAGPVVACACILDPVSIGKYRSKSKWYYRVRDSKTTYEDERLDLAEEIKSHCISYGIGEVDSQKIDQINIHNASLLAMKLAFTNMLINLSTCSKGDGQEQKNIFLFLDGRFIIKDLALKDGYLVEQRAVIDGDVSILSISAASIIAKVYRDKILKELHAQHPEYGFDKHKGYNTKAHREAIKKHGLTSFHRRSFLKNLAFA